MDYATLATFSRQATIEAPTKLARSDYFSHYNFVFLDMIVLELQSTQRISDCLLTD